MKKINLMNISFCFVFLCIININAQVVATFAGSGLSGSTNATGTAASFYNPIGVCVDASGNIYVADYANHKIRKVSPAGAVTTLAGSGTPGNTDATGTAASFNSPNGVCADASGNIYVADYGNNKIRKISPAGAVTTFAGSGALGSTDATGTAASFNSPIGVCVDASGNIYVADSSNRKIRKISPTGVVTTFAGSGVSGSTDATGTSASFNNPADVCADASGNIYVADYNANKIRKITPAGVVTTLAGSGAVGSINAVGTAASFNGPRGVCADASGNIYVADKNNYKIRKISLAGVVTTYAGSGISGSTDATGTAASFNTPYGVCADASGNIYVSDSYNHKIRKISPPPAATLDFDGVNDYVLVPDATINNLTSGTIESWIFLNSNNEEVICAKQHNFVGTYATLSIGNYASAGGSIAGTAGKIYFYSTNGVATASSNTNLNTGQWYHVAVTFNNTDAKIYINGALDNTVAGNYSIPSDLTSTGTSIGGWLGDGGGRYFSGKMDEFRIWNRALCQGEIQNNINGEIATSAAGLIANYHFNQGIDGGSNPTITSLLDASGNNLNGTLTDFALTGTTSNWVSPGAVTIGSLSPVFFSPVISVAGASTICSGVATTFTASGNVSTYTWI